jgi:putative transposase
MSRRPRRADGFSYVGMARYFLTCCTAQRASLFTDSEVVTQTLTQIRHVLAAPDFVIPAYCFMPDHLHLLIEATSEGAVLPEAVRVMKQRSAFRFKRRTGRSLWQTGYYDRVLRDDEATLSVARYIVANPVRAGLVESPRDYPYLGSDVYSMEALLDGLGVDWRP